MTLARAGAEDEPHTHVNLKQLVDDIVNSISLHARELEVSVSLEFDRPSIFTDRIRLRQILANLISNARKFSDPSELAPSILVQVTTSGENRVVLPHTQGTVWAYILPRNMSTSWVAAFAWRTHQSQRFSKYYCL